MKLSLSENICRLRKANHMTQEQLAEALGVSFAAVSKWERGAATPELNLITDMADLFDVSVDVLIGYQMRNNKKDSVIQRLKDYVHDRNSEEALSDVEKALKRYPNCFEIVYHSAVNYEVRGICQENPSYSRRALTLYHHACRLIGQNTEPEISEISLWKSIAGIHITLGEPEKGIDILKTHNPCRLNHPLIGQTLASVCNDPKGALPYLSKALLDLYAAQMQIVIGYINVYCKLKDYQNAIAFLEWAFSFYPGLKKPGTANFMDKGEAVLWAIQAYLHLQLKETEKAIHCLTHAREVARQFDANPNYSSSGLRFVSDDIVASSVDDIGQTAMDGITKMVSDFENNDLSTLWEQVKSERSTESI